MNPENTKFTVTVKNTEKREMKASELCMLYIRESFTLDRGLKDACRTELARLGYQCKEPIKGRSGHYMATFETTIKRGATYDEIIAWNAICHQHACSEKMGCLECPYNGMDCPDSDALEFARHLLKDKEITVESKED